MPSHFSEPALKFLRGLKRHNDREWFEARRTTWETACKAPMLALIAEINEAMADFAPANLRPPHKAMMRIYRDIRFSADKRPYKNHMAAWWGPAGMSRTSGGGFYLAIGSDAVTVAAGVYMPDRDQTLAIRRHLAEHHALMRRVLAAK